jgi:hypothetical protein
MLSVTARKIRDHRRDGRQGREGLGGPGFRDHAGVGRVYEGYLVSYPAVGRGLVIFRDPNGHRMITSPVRRVLGRPEEGSLYIETDNSVYRLTFHAPVERVGTPKPTPDSLDVAVGDRTVEHPRGE